MLCAKYDYKMDIAVKKEEAFAEGKEVANAEAAKKMLLKNYSISDIAEITGLSTEQIIELKEKTL